MLPQNSIPRKTPRKQRILPPRAAHLKYRPVSAFMRVDNALIDEYWRLIGLGEKAVLIAVMRLIDKSKQPAAVISVKQIVDYAGLSANSVRTALDDLTARGLVVMVAPATARSAATYNIAYPNIAAAPVSQRMTHDETVAAITATVSDELSPAQQRIAFHERKQRGKAIARVVSNPAPAAPDSLEAIQRRAALVNAPEYPALYDAVHKTVFGNDIETPESRIGKVTRALLELQPSCTPVELQDCAAWYNTTRNSPLPCGKDSPPLIAAALQDYRAARTIASESECAHDAA